MVIQSPLSSANKKQNAKVLPFAFLIIMKKGKLLLSFFQVYLNLQRQ